MQIVLSFYKNKEKYGIGFLKQERIEKITIKIIGIKNLISMIKIVLKSYHNSFLKLSN